jgi:hypothetical protein
MISLVDPDPHGKVSDPSMHSPDLRVRPKISTFPRTGPGPLLVRSGPPMAKSRDRNTLA